MNGFVQVPSKGQPMTAQWGADVANGLNSIRSAGQNGMLLTDGPTGTGFAPLPANLRDRRGGTPATDRSCFRIESRSVEVEDGEEGETEIHRFLVDCYYNAGGKTDAVEDIDIEDLIPHPEDETAEGGEEFDTVIYFAKDPSGEDYVGACYLDELPDIQNDADNYAFALYLFDSDGNLKTDLRTAPHLQMFEGGLS